MPDSHREQEREHLSQAFPSDSGTRLGKAFWPLARKEPKGGWVIRDLGLGGIFLHL